jgi:hypothetical protein
MPGVDYPADYYYSATIAQGLRIKKLFSILPEKIVRLALSPPIA